MDAVVRQKGSNLPLRFLHHDVSLDDLEPSNSRRYLADNFRSQEIPAEWRQYVKNLYWGKLSPGEVTIPEPPSVRLYLCSGIDMDTERGIVHNEIAPLLQDYCWSTHGVEFQVVDIRQGTPEHLLDEPWTRDLCLAELESCMRTSSGPSFGVVIGMKYGRQMLPSRIPDATFIAIRSGLKHAGSDVSLLDTWYWRNTNVTPPVYLLQRNVDNGEGLRETWQNYSDELIQLLDEGINSAVSLRIIEEDQCAQLTSSLVGAEVLKGVQCEHPDVKCFGYIRFLTDKNKDMTSPEAMQYIDGDPMSCQIDAAAFQSISHLCADVIPEVLGDTKNLQTFSVSWKTLAGLGDNSARKEYAVTFSRFLYQTCRRLIDETCARKRAAFRHELVKEVGDHWRIAGEISEATLIREDIARCVQAYLVGADTDQCLVLHGPPVVGKSVIVAQIARFVQSSSAELFPGLQSAVIVRFCGSMSGTSTLRHLLFTLCLQIYDVMGKQPSEIPEDCEQLKTLFTTLITEAEFSGVLVILLDGIDKIHPCEDAHLLEWIPMKIANNLKLILTVSEEASGLLSSLSRKIQAEYFMRIPGLNSEACSDILKAWIIRSGRALTPSQWKSLRQATQTCDTPVFLRLLLNQAVSWASYDIIKSEDLPNSSSEAVGHFFSRLERRHGYLLCSKTFGYLVSADGGLSQKELTDVLRLDEELLDSLRIPSKHRNKVREFPVWYLYRLLHDVSKFLKSTVIDGTPLLSWTEAFIHNAAVERYTRKTSTKHKLYSVLSDYFLRQWRGVTRQQSVCESFSEVPSDDDVIPQRLGERIPILPDASRMFNQRVSRTLPKCLAAAERHDMLKSEILCNLEWIRAKLATAPIAELFMDYGHGVDKESQLVLVALQMASRSLALDLNLLGIELTGRLLPYSSKYKHIRMLIRQCDLAAQRYNPCIPNCQLYESPGGPLLSECLLSTDSRQICWFQTSDGLMVAVPNPANKSTDLWNLSLQRQVRGVSLPTGNFYPTSCGDSVCVVGQDNTISAHYTDTGQEQWTTKCDKDIAELVVGEHYLAFTTKKGPGPTVLDVDNGELIHRLFHHCRCVAISAEDKFLLCGSDTSLFLYTLPLVERQLVIETGEIVLKLKFFTAACKFLILSNAGRLSLYNSDLAFKSFSTVRLVRDFEILDFVLNNKENMVLVRSAHCLRICDVMQGTLVHTLNALPGNVCMDRSSVFSGAAFTPDSCLVVASRYTYLCVWDSQTGQPLRILLSTKSPIERLFTSSDSSLAACLLANGLMKVWNLDKLEEHAKLTNTATDDEVRYLAMSCQTNTILCCAAGQCEAKILDAGNGEIIGSFEHREGSEVNDITLSPDGRFAITSSSCVDLGEDTEVDVGSVSNTDDSCLREAILWETISGRKIHHALNVKFSVFSQDSCVVSFVTDVPDERHIYSYAAVTIDIEQKIEHYTELFSAAEFVSPPFLLQFRSKVNSDTNNNNNQNSDLLLVDNNQKNSDLLVVGVVKSDSPSKTESASQGAFKSYVFVSSVSENDRNEANFLSIQNLMVKANTNDQILHATAMKDGRVLFIYSDAREIDRSGNSTILSTETAASAFIYDFQTHCALRHFPQFLSPASVVEDTVFSPTFTFALDSNLELLNLKTGDKVEKLSGFDPKLCAFALDGRYICALTTSRKEVLVIRSCDGLVKGRLLVYGQGTALCVAENGRTVSVGCDNGRVLIFSLILELSDPLREFAGQLPSRETLDTGCALLERDIARITSASSDLRRLSAKLDHTRLSERRRPSSYRLLTNSVHMTQNLNRLRGSQTCCMQ
ncbi:NACHT and WD repeat domain-containing protein 2-like isoform X2 [Liolophura sinensis]|uniref:NACHT and WD repeat domain-containing protein 2-like isoform X2 n=1 Tax=Liolophura sinensis TaxID=3198878 RepID=UPI003158236F